MQKRALISVSDKSGLSELAGALHNAGFEILATGGTARMIEQHGIPVRSVEDVTRFPEILGGRVKTLHPMIFAGILARRDNATDRQEIQQHHIGLIDLVVVNLYPFESYARAGTPFRALMEWIDIGGPSLIRAAAKNWPWVTVITDPNDYPALITHLQSGNWPPPEDFRLQMAAKAFAHTALYDSVIAHTFATAAGNGPASAWTVGLRLREILRYGENPHQAGYWYVRVPEPGVGLHHARQLQGKPLSYNNLLDLDAAVRVIADFEGETDGVPAVVIKHNTPCGVAVGSTARDAYVRARDADALSAFGGIAAIGAVVDRPTAEAITETFMECIIAPGYTDDALEVLARKKNLRVLELAGPWHPGTSFEMRTVLGGMLVQAGDWIEDDPESWKVVTRRMPTETEFQALRFAWRVVKHVKSNAIVLARATQTLGIGAGQMSRVDAVRIAIMKAGDRDLHGAVCASDAFFPFRDNIDVLHEAGITAVIQPGGSIRDEEVIAAANAYNMAMVFTGVRHFRH